MTQFPKSRRHIFPVSFTVAVLWVTNHATLSSRCAGCLQGQRSVRVIAGSVCMFGLSGFWLIIKMSFYPHIVILCVTLKRTNTFMPALG